MYAVFYQNMYDPEKIDLATCNDIVSKTGAKYDIVKFNVKTSISLPEKEVEKRIIRYMARRADNPDDPLSPLTKAEFVNKKVTPVEHIARLKEKYPLSEITLTKVISDSQGEKVFIFELNTQERMMCFHFEPAQIMRLIENYDGIDISKRANYSPVLYHINI